MKNIYFISILSLFLMSCSTHRNVVVINGSLSDFPADSSSYVYLFQSWGNQISLVDSAEIAHGEFKLVTQISESTDAQLIIPVMVQKLARFCTALAEKTQLFSLLFFVDFIDV